MGARRGGHRRDLHRRRFHRGRAAPRHKDPSTPADPERGVLAGIESLHGDGHLEFGAVDVFAPGTTVATNAVIERRGARAALVTTEGFRDVLEIGRQNRPDIYDFQAEKPTPVVERNRRFEVPERLDDRGGVRTPLDESAVRELAADLDSLGVESVAICLLFSFENDTHERRVEEIFETEGIDALFSLSSQMLPEIREYERTLTTALNTALKPVMDAYIGNLETDVREAGVAAYMRIMQSNGGIITAEAFYPAYDAANQTISAPGGATDPSTPCCPGLQLASRGRLRSLIWLASTTSSRWTWVGPPVTCHS